jgi:hypothetical protein
MSSFPYKTPPFEHQREALRRSATARGFMLAMEQGTGKTKTIIDTVGWLYLRERVRRLLVVAPMGADKMWLSDEIPAHMTEALTYDTFLFRVGKADTKRFQLRLDGFLKDPDVLQIAAMNIEALATDKGYKFAQRFLRTAPGMMVVDESNIIASASTAQARAARRLGRMAAFVRCLDGTPGTESPFHLYGQYMFLIPEVLRRAGVGNSTLFKKHYGIWQNIELSGQGDIPKELRRTFPKLIEYQNLDHLAALVEPYTFRVLKDDVLDLPPKVYRKRYIELSPRQRELYDELKREFTIEAQDRIIDADLAIQRVTRLQQIASGFLPAIGEEPEVAIEGPTPRADAVCAEFGAYPVKTLIWSRFRMERDILQARLEGLGVRVVRYDGETDERTRDRNKRVFQEDSDAIQVMLCSEAAARSHTFHAAKHNIYVSNFVRVLQRIQSEDRSHRAGLRHSQLYTDIVAVNTLDEDRLKSYREKKASADIIHKDPYKEWI